MDAISAMKMVPQDAKSFYFRDIAAIRAEGNLERLLQVASEGVDVVGEKNIDSIAESGGLTILWGIFDLAKIRGNLEDMGYEKGEYDGVETWENSYRVVALVDSHCTVCGARADAEGCINTTKGKSGSLYDSQDVRDIMAALPGDGLLVSWVADETLGPYRRGIEGTATSTSRKNADELHYACISRFEDATSASSAMESTREYIEEWDEDVTNVSVSLDGRDVRATFDLPI